MPDHDPAAHDRTGVPEPDTGSAHEHARAWLSATRDGEAPAPTAAHATGARAEADAGAALAHLAACTDCARWQSALDGVERALATTTTTAAPAGLTAAAISAYAREQARPSASERAARLLLAAAGVAGILLAVLSLRLTPGVHLEHDLLGFEVAFAIGFLLCARDPARYGRALLPITAVASLVVLLPSAAAAASAPVNLLAEAGHLSVLTGLAGLILLAGAGRAPEKGDPDRPAALWPASP